VAAVAARWGLTSPAWFSQAFKAAHGMAPGEYRRRSAGS
jgi:AraC-like DNA-binding protein